jgi:hypothetical protein
MGKNVIVSEETIRDLLEAHASLSAWYYELSAALREANAVASTPDEDKRAAFVERLSIDFPEVAQIARSITVPRMYVPPPPAVSQVVPAGRREPATFIEPAAARARERSDLADDDPTGLIEASKLTR